VALQTDGSLWVWGRNNHGQLGLGTIPSTNRPAPVGTTRDWRAVMAGGSHTMAVKTNDTLWAWGWNNHG